MKRIYVAGPYSRGDCLTILDNIRNGMRAATRILLAGYAPFCPWFDFHFQLMLLDGESLGINDYHRYSIEWLKVSDAMVVLPGYSDSGGTVNEIMLAKILGIPIYYGIDSFLKEAGQS